MATATTYSVNKILEGKEAGRPQIVGLMEVIPLIAQDETHFTRAFSVPSADMELAGNPTYGSVTLKNRGSGPLVTPTNATWVTKHAAQDHAMAKAGLLGPGKTQRYDNAACVQATQGGAIPAGQHAFQILPATLRKGITKELADRREYGKFWPNIAAMNSSLGINDRGGHLTMMFEQFAKELMQFIAEFEIVKNQIGAIILINGQLVGIEIAPTPEYWKSVWEPLIRFCYGPEALLASRKLGEQGLKTAMESRPRMNINNVRTLDDLDQALSNLRKAEQERAEKSIRDVIDTSLNFEIDTKLPFNDPSLGNVTYTLLSTYKDYVGQIVEDEGYVVYCSLVNASAMTRRPQRASFRFNT
jgi:hypothetical protein